MLQRFALGVEYDGSVFCGFQKQKGPKTVQGALEKALSKFADHSISVISAGRTDSGVHARGQVIHFDTKAHRASDLWCTGVNACLDPAVRIVWARSVRSDFHARNWAVARVYRYFIYNHPIRPSILRQHLTWYRPALDLKRMQQAANYWLGEHDFSAFRAGACQSHSPIKKIHHIKITRTADLICVEIKANAFLQHMIRNMMGVLLPIGEGRYPMAHARKVLESRDRKQAGVTSAPNGLYLEAVFYPEEENIPVLAHSRDRIDIGMEI